MIAVEYHVGLQYSANSDGDGVQSESLFYNGFGVYCTFQSFGCNDAVVIWNKFQRFGLEFVECLGISRQVIKSESRAVGRLK